MTTDHFHNFASADAVQYDGDGSNVTAIIKFIMRGKWQTESVNWRDDDTHIWSSEAGHIDPGQWLVRQGDRVWVQDEEPARVESRLWAVADPWSTFFPEPNRFSMGTHLTRESAVEQRSRLGLKGWVLLSQPTVRTPDGLIWTGPWSPVEGGAE